MGMAWSDYHGEHFAGRRVLVTGAAGFIGSHLTQALTELGAAVSALDEEPWWRAINLQQIGFERRGYIHCGTTDLEAVRAAVRGTSLVFHLADVRAISTPRWIEQYFGGVGTLNVVQAAAMHGVRRVVYASSRRIYRNDCVPPVTEEMSEADPPRGVSRQTSGYRAEKETGELLMRRFAEEGVDTVSLRFFDTFGPRQRMDSVYGSVIPHMAKPILSEQPPVIYGDGEQTRDLNFVNNAVHAALLAARHPTPLGGEAFNIGSGSAISINDVARAMAGAIGRPDCRLVHEPDCEGDQRHIYPEVRRAREVLGYRPLVEFEPGLQETLRWYLKYGFV